MTQNENKFAEIDQTLQQQSRNHAQLQKRIDSLELGNTGQGNHITYVYHNMEELNQHPKLYGDENESDRLPKGVRKDNGIYWKSLDTSGYD